MRSPLESGTLLELDSVTSTQDVLAAELKQATGVTAVLALEQTGGRGRFQRQWHSPPGECLAVSMAFPQYQAHTQPYLVGMAVALAAGQAFDCQLRWPNDLMLDGRKLGGVLTELTPSQIPIVGLGLNLNQAHFPDDIRHLATSLFLSRGTQTSPKQALERLLDSIESLPEPNHWADLEPHWMQRDDTPGKRYRLPDGTEATAIRIGAQGQLIATQGNKSIEVLAADALQ